MRVARQVHCNQYLGASIFQSGVCIVQATVGGDSLGALELAHHHLALVRAEHAEAAAALLERWAFGPPVECAAPPLQIGQVARLLGVSFDIVRSCDRNGLIDIPRDPVNG